MIRFILARLLTVVPTFIGITMLVFLLVHLIPGDPVEVMMGERGMSAAEHAQALHRLGLDQPLPLQYWRYLSHAVRGDLGVSLVSNTSVMQEFLTRFPATVELSVCALLFALVIGVPAGVVAALRRGTALDHGVMGTALAGYSMPIFWWGLILIMFFSVGLGWTPVSGRIAVEYDVPSVTGFMLVDSLLSTEPGAFRSALSHLVLPMIVLGTIPLAVIARMTRSSMLEVLREDYIRTARAKGLAPLRVVVVHALRNALIPVVTAIGLQVSLLLAGAVLTETTFSWPGIGKWLIDAVGRRDYPVVQGAILLIALLVIAVNFCVDLAYGLLNPRIRHTR
ncbi:ABC transporter permease subunit [Pararobbsia alpina]|uniref:Dipeptide transport system permease protein DppB n=1 Tax=Pararobbsia alpina TaxID=621374 RepID=A0A6S7AW17_9BURK|nr:ABC transporter permease subunit [Pararobbsia alpina]CAB3778954.1 Dipeptide transport system permease protein DppB [Pararobbsia alpina]